MTRASSPNPKAASPPERPVGKRALWRRIARWFGIAVLVLLGLVGIAIAIIHTDWGREQVRRQAESQLSELFVGDVVIERISGSVLSDFAVHGITIEDGTGAPAVTVDRLDIDYSPLSLLAEHVDVDSIKLVGVAIEGRPGEDGTLNLATLLAEPDEPDTGPSPWVVDLRRIELVDSDLTIASQEPGAAPLRLSHIGGAFEVSIAGGVVTATIAELAARWTEPGGTSARDVELVGAVRIDGPRIDATGVSAKVGGARLDIRNAALIGDNIGALSLSATVPRALAAELSPGIGLAGDLSLEIETVARNPGEPQPGTDDALPELAAVVKVGEQRLDARLIASIEPPAIRGTMTADDIDLAKVWLGLPPSALDTSVELSLDGDSIESARGFVELKASGPLERARLEHAVARVDLARGVATVAVTAKPSRGTVDLGARVRVTEPLTIETAVLKANHPRVQELIGAAAPVAGGVDIRANASGTIAALKTDGTAKLSGFRAGSVSARPTSTIAWNLKRAGLGATGTATAKVRALRSGTSSLGDVDVDAVLRGDGRRGTVTVQSRGGDAIERLSLDATVVQTDAAIRVDLDRLSAVARSLPWRASGGKIVYHESGRLELSDFTAASAAGSVTASADVVLGGESGLRSGQVELRGQRIELAKLRDALAIDAPLAGTATVTAKLDKRRGVVRGRALVRGTGLRFRTGVPALATELEVGLSGRDIELSGRIDGGDAGSAEVAARGRAPADPLSVAGYQRMGKRVIASALIRADIADIAKLGALHPELPTSGSARVVAKASKSLSRMSVEVQAANVVAPRLSEAADFDAAATLDGGTLTVSGRAAVAKRGSLVWSASGAAPADVTAFDAWRRRGVSALSGADAKLDRLDVDWWANVAGARLQPTDATVHGTVLVSPGAADAAARLFVEQPRGGTAKRRHAARLEIGLGVTPDRTRATVGAFVDGRRVIDGKANLAVGWRAAVRAPDKLATAQTDATFSIDKIPLAVARDITRRTVLEGELPIKGELTATATMKGTVREPTATADLDLTGAVIAGIRFKELQAKGTYDRGKAELRAIASQAKGGRVEVSARTQVSASGARPIRASLDARKFDLSFLKEVMPQRGIAGVLDGRLVATGTDRAPSVLGSLTVKTAGFLPGEPLFALRGGTVKAVFTPNKVKLDASARSGRGKVTVDGEVGVDKLFVKDFAFDVRSNKLPIEAGGLLVSVDTETKLRGRREGTDWRIDTDIGDTILFLPDADARDLHATGLPSDIVFVGDKTSEQDRGGKLKPPAPQSAMIVKIRAPETIEVRSTQASAVAAIDVTLEVRDDVALTGTVSTQRGSVEIVGRRYDVRRGLVSFDGSTDPNLDIELSHEFTSSTLFIDVTGTSSNPEVSFRSNPPRYSESELLAFVLGGSPDEASTERTAGDRAAGIATSVIASRVQGLIRDVAPIDVFRVDLAEDESTAETLVLGKWITRRLLVAYRHRFEATEDENSGEAKIEYRFLKRWFIEAFYGDRGVGGADVIWIKRY